MDDQSIEIWMASHIDNRQRLIYLQSNIQHLESIPSTVRIRLSVSYDIDIQEMKECKYKNIEIHFQSKPLRQFEHLSFLINTSKRSVDLKIVFLDDDDTLFPEFLSSKCLFANKAGLGFQCRNMDYKYPIELSCAEVVMLFGDNIESISSGHRNQVVKEHNNTYYELKSDFSGTWCTLDMLIKFVSGCHIHPTTDGEFRYFISRQGYKCPTLPNVFGRRWMIFPYWANDQAKTVTICRLRENVIDSIKKVKQNLLNAL